MTEAVLLWGAALVAASAAVLLGVVAAGRHRRTRRTRRRTDARSAVRPQLLELMAGTGTLPDWKALDTEHRRALDELLFDYLLKVRGDARDRLLALVEALDLPARAMVAARSPSTISRVRAAELLGRIGTPVTVQPLVELLADPRRPVRTAAAESLGVSCAVTTVPLLMQASGGAVATDVVTWSICQMGEAAVPELLSCASWSDERVRSACINAIRALRATALTSGA